MKYAYFADLTDQQLCAQSAKERKSHPSDDQPKCHALMCRAFFGKSTEAMECILENYGGEFASWITQNDLFRQLQQCYSGLQSADILHDVIARLYARLQHKTDCYTHFPRLAGFFAFIKISIRNREIELLRRCRFVVPLTPGLPSAATHSPMEKIEARVRELLTDEEYIVWEYWIYGVPERAKVISKIGGENRLNPLKRSVRKKLYADPLIRQLLDMAS